LHVGALDYSKGCVNFRDVGECVNLLAGRDILPVGRILRGGKLEFVESADQISSPGTIINLRKGPDLEEKRFGADYWQFSISNDHEKYDTTDPVVRRWLSEVFACIADEVSRFPVLFHCTSGKDRTGVVVAALLTVLAVERELVVQEYLWSEGEVARAWIESSLIRIGDPATYFRRVDLVSLKRKVLGAEACT
jgi:protein-tyrosine phosphatase